MHVKNTRLSRKRKLLFLLVLLLVLPILVLIVQRVQTIRRHTAVGTVYYISPTGNDINPGTLTAPWKTAHKAAITLTAGETAIFEDGTYNETQRVRMNQSGTPSAPITLKAKNKWGAKLYYLNPAVAPAFDVYGTDVIFDGFDFDQAVMGNCCQEFAIRGWYGSDRLIIRNIRVKQFATAFKANGNYSIVENNVTQGIGFISVVNSLGVIIRNNDISDVNTEGIVVKGGTRLAKIYNNFIHNDGVIHGWNGIILGGYSNNCYGDLYDPTGMGYEAYNVVAYNNVVQGNFDGGLTFQGAKNSAFFNNVVIGVGWGIAGNAGARNEQYCWAHDVNNVKPILMNNIFLNCTGGAGSVGATEGPVTIDNNLFSRCVSAPAQAHPVTGNPLFVNIAVVVRDWHFQSIFKFLPFYLTNEVVFARIRDAAGEPAP